MIDDYLHWREQSGMHNFFTYVFSSFHGVEVEDEGG